jgi:hypothetical protein
MSRIRVGLLVFVITLMGASHAHAHASKRRVSTHYWARFQWRDGQKLQLVVYRKFAQVQTLDGKLVASCDIKPLDQSTVDMNCKSAGFSPLTSHAALYIGERQGKKVGVLRFGTWLSGYEQATLELASSGEYTRRPYATH